MKSLILPAALALAATFANPVSAIAAEGAANPVKHHLQCFLAMSALAGSDDTKIQEAGTTGAMFFAGQVFGASPDIDLSAAAKAEMAFITDDQLPGLLTDCGHELERRGNQMQEAGKALGGN